jgi:YHS domain-containing protein
MTNISSKQYLSVLLVVATVGATAFALPAMGAPPMPQVTHERSPDMETIHRLFAHTDKIRRTVRKLPNGVETLTESGDPTVRVLLREHVHAMHVRLQKREPIRAWDPLFAEVFKQAGKIKIQITDTKQGVRVTETSADPYTVTLLHAHADAVSGFVTEGPAGMAKRHELPQPKAVGKRDRPQFLGKGDGVRTCPVTGEPVDKNVKAVIDGRTVYFCCASCIAIVKEKPGRYLPWKRPAP